MTTIKNRPNTALLVVDVLDEDLLPARGPGDEADLVVVLSRGEQPAARPVGADDHECDLER